MKAKSVKGVRVRYARLLLVAVASILLLAGCSPSQTTTPAVEPTCSSFTDSLEQKLKQTASILGTQALDTCFEQAYGTYVSSRVSEVALPERSPASFGPWEAQDDYLTTDARDDGSLTQWYDHYYITHEWSEIGQQILGLIPGDTVVVNGSPFTIEGVFNYPKDSYYDEIVQLVGANKTVLQTCYPDSEQNRIAYGS